MERLTRRMCGGWVVEPGYELNTARGVKAVIDRLAAYEDTGLGPEKVTAIKNVVMGQEIAKITEFEGIPIQRLRELAQAEKDGRLVVLPEWRSEDPPLKRENETSYCPHNCQNKDCVGGQCLVRNGPKAALKKSEEAGNEHDH